MKNKIGKLLCLLIISFFIIGFGGERVRAIYVTSAGTLRYRSYTYFQHIKYGDKDVYCLNSSKRFPGGKELPLVTGLIPENKVNGIIRIINKSSELGLSSGENYYITQTAIWYYLYGIKPNGTDGITQGFYNWVTTSKYASYWDNLIKSAFNEDEMVNNYTIEINGNSSKLDTDSEDDTYLISEDFSIKSNITGIFTVTIDDGSASDSCILKSDNSCSETIEVNADENFKIKVKKPADEHGTVDVSFTAVPNTNPTVYKLNTYGGIDVVNVGLQSVVELITEPKAMSAKRAVNGQYSNENSKEVSIQKVDSVTGTKVAGALLKITDVNGSKIGTYTSTGEGTANPSVELPVGIYRLSEVSAPKGYTLSKEVIEFEVVKDGSNVVVKQNGTTVDSATISFENYERVIKFRKVDYNGDPISGLKFLITSYVYGSTTGADAKKTLCAYSDSDGYLTVPCKDEDYESHSSYARAKSSGLYVLGKDFGDTDDVFIIDEICDNNSCKGYDTSLINRFPMHFQVSKDNISAFNSFITIDYDNSGAIPVVSVTMENKAYIDISKTDITTGAEIGGAYLVVRDRESLIFGDPVIDEWESVAGETHRVKGIEFNHRYVISETIAPDGYVKMITTSVEFEMDENGNIKVYDEDDNEITDLASSDYKLLIPNDYTKVQISKVDMVSGEEVEGARLKVCTIEQYNADGLDCKDTAHSDWEWTSSDKPHKIDRLKEGWYALIETIAPAGYAKKTSAVLFEVKKTGEIQSFGMKNKMTKVTISKKDKESGEYLSGAHFQILEAESREVAYTNTGVKLDWDSEQKPYEILGLASGKYILVETVYPNGYQEGMIINDQIVNEFEFTVGETEDDVDIEVYVEVLNAPNTGISTLNLFAIGGLMVFVGYEIIKMYNRKVILK